MFRGCFIVLCIYCSNLSYPRSALFSPCCVFALQEGLCTIMRCTMVLEECHFSDVYEQYNGITLKKKNALTMAVLTIALVSGITLLQKVEVLRVETCLYFWNFSFLLSSLYSCLAKSSSCIK